MTLHRFPVGVPTHDEVTAKDDRRMANEHIKRATLKLGTELEIGLCKLKNVSLLHLTSLEQLEAAIQTIRGQGFALEDEEGEYGIRCIGAPISIIKAC